MRILYVLVAILTVLNAGCIDDKPHQGATVQIEPLSCTIRGERTCERGKVPDITVAITNQTNTDIYLVGSLDGSHCKWRYPYCYFEVTRPDGTSALPPGKGCVDMNELREKDFVKVPPGETFDPYQEIDEEGFFPSWQLVADTFRIAGEYRIRFVYSSRSEIIREWFGDAANARLFNLFRQVPKVEIRSNEIKVTIVEPDK